MKKVLKKSEVLKEGYEAGLRAGLEVINQMIAAQENGEMLDEGFLSQLKSFGQGFKKQASANKANNEEQDKAIADAKAKKKSASQAISNADAAWKKTEKNAPDEYDGETAKQAHKERQQNILNKKTQAQKDVNAANQNIKDAKSKKTGLVNGLKGAWNSGVKSFNNQKKADVDAAEKAKKKKQAEKEQKTANDFVNQIKKAGSNVQNLVIKQLQNVAKKAQSGSNDEFSLKGTIFDS